MEHQQLLCRCSEELKQIAQMESDVNTQFKIFILRRGCGGEKRIKSNLKQID